MTRKKNFSKCISYINNLNLFPFIQHFGEKQETNQITCHWNSTFNFYIIFQHWLTYSHSIYIADESSVRLLKKEKYFGNVKFRVAIERDRRFIHCNDDCADYYTSNNIFETILRCHIELNLWMQFHFLNILLNLMDKWSIQLKTYWLNEIILLFVLLILLWLLFKLWGTYNWSCCCQFDDINN